MSILRIINFGGMVPKLDQRALPQGMSQLAVNCKLYSGALDSFYGPLQLATVTPASPQDFYHFVTSDGAQHYVGFAGPTDVVRAPILNDAFDRMYFTNSSGAYMTTRAGLASGAAAWLLGVPVPTFTSWTVTTSGGTSTNAETRVYIATLQTSYGEEGSASAPILATGNSDGTWTLNGLNGLTTSMVNYPTVDQLNVYRTVSTSSGVAYYRVASFFTNALPATYVDALTDSEAALQVQLQSLTWTPPPANLVGLVASPSGFLAGFVGRTVFFSEPYFPHAWPQQYQLAVEDDIVGLGIYGSTVVVCTTGRPYIIQGTQPGAMALVKVNQSIPCLSKRSIVSIGPAVYFATYDGIMQVSDSGISLATAPLLTKDQWLTTYSPSTIQADTFEGRYYAFFNNAQGFIFDPSSQSAPWVELSLPNVQTVRQSYVTGKLQVLVGTNVQEWDGDTTTRIPYTWVSAEFLIAKPSNLSALQLRGSFGTSQIPEPVQVSVSVDDVPRWTHGVASEKTVRMPRGFKGSCWTFTITGRQRVFSLSASGTATELELTP